MTKRQNKGPRWPAMFFEGFYTFKPMIKSECLLKEAQPLIAILFTVIILYKNRSNMGLGNCGRLHAFSK